MSAERGMGTRGVGGLACQDAATLLSHAGASFGAHVRVAGYAEGRAEGGWRLGVGILQSALTPGLNIFADLRF